MDYDGQLLSDVASVALRTYYGKIRARDLSAYESKLKSYAGDVVVDGTLEGLSVVETFQSGDILLKHVEGNSLTATSEAGNILVLGDCNASASHFYTKSGNMTLKYLYNMIHILVQQH